MTDIKYTLPLPGEPLPANHEEFCDILSLVSFDWDGDDYGISLQTPGGQLLIPPGTTVRLSVQGQSSTISARYPEGVVAYHCTGEAR